MVGNARKGMFSGGGGFGGGGRVSCAVVAPAAVLDAECILVKLRSSCLGVLSQRAGRSFEGLGAAARLCRQRGDISPNTSKKLSQLDVCCAWLRHACAAKADEFLSALCSEVGAAVGGDGGSVVGNGGTQAEASDAAVDAEDANALAWDTLPTH